MFPWRCSRQVDVLGSASNAAKRSAALTREAPRFAPGFPLPSASSFRCPVRSTPGPAILSFKRPSFTLAPIAVTKVAEPTFAPAPGASRFHTVTAPLRQPARQEACHAGCLSLRPPDTRSFELFAFEARTEAGASKAKCCCSWAEKPRNPCQDRAGRAIGRPPLSWIGRRLKGRNQEETDAKCSLMNGDRMSATFCC